MRRALLALALLAVFVPELARAQASAEATTDQARQHFELGVQLIGQGRWSDAVAELDAARAIHATPPVLYNLGIGLRGLGRVHEAIVRFQEFLELLGTRGTAARRTEVQGYITELTAMLGLLRLRVEPAGATVFVDGVRLPDGTTETQVDPGAHRVRAELAGYVASEQELQMERGGNALATFALEAVPTRGTLIVESAATAAEVTLDGAVVGSAPYEAQLEPGTHALIVRAPGHVPLERSIEIVVGESLRVQADLTREPSLIENPLLWVGIGGGVLVIAGVAIGVGVATSGTQAPYEGRLGLVTGLLTVPL